MTNDDITLDDLGLNETLVEASELNWSTDVTKTLIVFGKSIHAILILIADRMNSVGNKSFIWESKKWVSMYVCYDKWVVVSTLWRRVERMVDDTDGTKKSEMVIEELSFDAQNITSEDHLAVNFFLDFIQ